MGYIMLHNMPPGLALIWKRSELFHNAHDSLSLLRQQHSNLGRRQVVHERHPSIVRIVGLGITAQL